MGRHGFAYGTELYSPMDRSEHIFFFVENPCPPHTEIGGIPLMVASYRGEKPHTFRPDGFCYY